MRPRVCVAAVVASIALTLGATPALADTKTRVDPVGDAPAGIDITLARYSYENGRVSVRARVPDLARRGRADLSISRFEIFDAGYVVRLVKRAGKPPRTRLYFFDHFDLHRRPCDDVRGWWRNGAVRLSVDADCLEDHARRRIFTQVGLIRRQDFDMAPAVRRLARG
jgi:hypothetical protein